MNSKLKKSTKALKANSKVYLDNLWKGLKGKHLLISSDQMEFAKSLLSLQLIYKNDPTLTMTEFYHRCTKATGMTEVTCSGYVAAAREFGSVATKVLANTCMTSWMSLARARRDKKPVVDKIVAKIRSSKKYMTNAEVRMLIYGVKRKTKQYRKHVCSGQFSDGTPMTVEIYVGGEKPREQVQMLACTIIEDMVSV